MELHASAPMSDDCRATSDNSRDAILQSKKFDYLHKPGGDVSLRWGLPSFLRCCDTRHECHDTHDNSRDANLRSEMFDFVRLWGTFPSLGTSLIQGVADIAAPTRLSACFGTLSHTPVGYYLDVCKSGRPAELSCVTCVA